MKFPTRGENIFDFLLTNMEKNYETEIFSIIKSTIKSRDLAVSRYLEQVDVQGLVKSVESCE